MKLEVTLSDGRIITLKDKTKRQFYRKPHDIEIIGYDKGDLTYGGDGYRSGLVRDIVTTTGQQMPEVYRIPVDYVTPLSCDWINLWWGINPYLDVKHFTALLANDVAWTNNTGWPGHYNCLTGDDAGLDDPRLHAAIINGGAILGGEEIGGKLLIDAYTYDQAPPTATEMLSQPWKWFWGTTVKPSGEIGFISRKGTDGLYHPVRVPIVSREPLYIDLNWLHKLPPGYMPTDPTWKPAKNWTADFISVD